MLSGEQMRGAPCTEGDPERFFPPSSDKKGVEAARAECGTCDVLEQCAAWAIQENLSDGVVGGMGAPTRRAIRSQGHYERLRRTAAAVNVARRLAQKANET